MDFIDMLSASQTEVLTPEHWLNLAMYPQNPSSEEIPPTYVQQRRQSPNVIIFGETGAGKSSLVNLIVGSEVAPTSAGAAGCTLDSASYDVFLPDPQTRTHHIRLFDTVGLNEPSLGKTKYLSAVEKAHEFMCELQRTGGIRLLIFCIRGGRITAAAQNNYNLFRDILCQNEVPIAFVITGLENEVSMEGWWNKNAPEFEKCGMPCITHACVTAHRGLNGAHEQKYNESQQRVRAMLLEQISASGTSWNPERGGWFVRTAGRLLKWVFQATTTRRRARRRLKTLTQQELAQQLERKCGFSPSEAEYLAEKIWIERQIDADTPDLVKYEPNH